MIQNAFMELVVEAGFSAITIQMLADRAMINRATFYRHYEDIYDLTEKVYLNLSAEYLSSIEAILPAHPVESFQCLFEHCGKYSAFYLALLTELPRFQELIRDTGEQQIAALFKGMGLEEESMSVPLPIVLRYWMTAQMGLVQWWLEEGQTTPATEMADYLWSLMERGPLAALHLPQPTR